MQALFLLFLVVCGFALLRVIERRKAPLSLTLGLPRRGTARTEWATGAAIGWGLAIASVVPMMLTRSLNVHLWTVPRAFELLGIGLATLAVATLAHALAVFGYGFQRLIEATGPVRAALILAGLAALEVGLTPAFYETPGGTLLIAAHRELEALCLEREVAHFKQHVGLKYAELVYFGLWFTPLREALDAFVATTQTDITGSVTLSLYKGNVSVVSRQSEHSLYRTDLSSFTMGDSYDQKDAAGFIRILGLPSRTRARARVEVAR